MKHLMLLFLLTIIFNPLLAQSPDFTKVYHPHINQAELALIESDYKAALKHYQTAFANVEKGISSDYHNAIVCMMKLNKTQSPKLYDYIEILIKKGVTYSYFQTNLYSLIINNNRWERLFKKYEFTDGRCLTFINIELYNELDNLRKNNKKQHEKDDSYHIDSLLIERFKEIVEKHGYPSEDIIGVEYPKNPRICYDFVMRNYFQKRSMEEWKHLEDISPMIINAIKKGALKPQKGSFWLKLQGGNFQLGDLILNKFQNGNEDLDGFYVEKIDGEYLKTVNQNRLSIGMSSLQGFYKKAVYLQNNQETEYLLSQRGGLNVFNGDADFLAQMLPYYKKIEIEND